MARKARKARTRPVDWRLEKHANGEYKNDDGLWRVVDGTGETIGLVNDDICMAVFAHRHLLEIAKATRNMMRNLNALDINWANSDHLIQDRGVGQMTPDMLKNGVWRVFCGLSETEAVAQKIVCKTCNDTHLMQLDEQSVMCTHCPTPCQQCRGDEGRGPFCDKTPCPCSCHNNVEHLLDEMVERGTWKELLKGHNAKAVSGETESGGAGEPTGDNPGDCKGSSSTDPVHEDGK